MPPKKIFTPDSLPHKHHLRESGIICVFFNFRKSKNIGKGPASYSSAIRIRSITRKTSWSDMAGKSGRLNAWE